MNNNICKFIPSYDNSMTIHIINFVYETQKQVYNMLKIESLYKVHYVCSGKGRLHTTGVVQELNEGDVFFTFPAMPYCIESCENFSYMYISYLGNRGNMILDKLNINTSDFLFHSCGRIASFWIEGISLNSSMTELIAESVLLYTFSFIANMYLSDGCMQKKDSTFLQIKKYIDDHLSDSSLSLEKIGNELCYNQKYISAVFKKHFKIGFSEYLNNVRIHYACTMIQQGYRSVSDISRLCGYSDSHYFSKVFKKITGQTPRTYIYSQSEQ